MVQFLVHAAWAKQWMRAIAIFLIMEIAGAVTNPIVIRGNLLYDSVTNERFYVKGVAYDAEPQCVDWFTDVLGNNYTHPYMDWRADLRDMKKVA